MKVLCRSTAGCSLSGFTRESASFRMSRACRVPSPRMNGRQRARDTLRKKKCARPLKRQLTRLTQSRRTPKLSRKLERPRKWRSCGQRSRNCLLCASLCQIGCVASVLSLRSPRRSPLRCGVASCKTLDGVEIYSVSCQGEGLVQVCVCENACHSVTWQSLAMTSSLRFSLCRRRGAGSRTNGHIDVHAVIRFSSQERCVPLVNR